MKSQVNGRAAEVMLAVLSVCVAVEYGQSTLLGVHSPHRPRAVSGRHDRGSCTHWCPHGSAITPNPDFTPVPNGCGSYGFTVNLSTIPDAEDCCNQHDMCYKTCGNSKSRCDFRMKSCMKKKCREYRSRGAGFFKYYGCKMTMYGAYGAVKMFGCRAFKKDQRLSCKCLPK